MDTPAPTDQQIQDEERERRKRQEEALEDA
jgi:hypothetical protein